MRKLAVLLVGACWAAVVFLCTGYLTFPGDALAERAEYEIYTGSRKAYVAELGDLSPWWFGASTPEVKLFGKAKRDGTSPLLMYASDARISASPLSLLMRTPAVNGSVTLGESGTLYYDLETASVNDQLVPSSVEINAQSFPVNELLAMVPNVELTGSGLANIDIQVRPPEGMSAADGKIEITGKNIKLVNPVIEGIGPLGRDVNISVLDLVLKISEGEAKITRGRIKSDVADIEITGTMELEDDFNRSQIDWRLEVEPDESMAIIKQVFSKAEKNGKLQFTCRGRLSSIDRACRAGAGSVAKARPRPRPRPRPSAKGTAAKGKTAPRPPGMTPEEREERKKELQERLRKRREERRAAGKTAKGGADGDPLGAEDDEEEFEDEELEDEELEEEGGEDDELLDDEELEE